MEDCKQRWKSVGGLWSARVNAIGSNVAYRQSNHHQASNQLCRIYRGEQRVSPVQDRGKNRQSGPEPLFFLCNLSFDSDQIQTTTTTGRKRNWAKRYSAKKKIHRPGCLLLADCCHKHILLNRMQHGLMLFKKESHQYRYLICSFCSRLKLS